MEGTFLEMTGRYLLDTCVILYAMASPDRLSRTAKAVLTSNEAEIWVSPVSAWEAAQKWSAGKLNLPAPPSVLFTAWLAAERIQELPFTFADVWEGQGLPWPHSDPFDRMLASQALANDLTLITPDRYLHQYPSRSLW